MKRLLACISTRARLAAMVVGLSLLCSVARSAPTSAIEIKVVSSSYTNRNTARSHLDSMRSVGYVFGHGVYINDQYYKPYIKSVNGNTVTIRYKVGVMYQRFRTWRGGNRSAFAIVGDNGLCPVAGWYVHCPNCQPAFDCVKYQDMGHWDHDQTRKGNKCNNPVYPGAEVIVNTCNYSYATGPGVRNGQPWDTVHRRAPEEVPPWITELFYDMEKSVNIDLSRKSGEMEVLTDSNKACMYYHDESTSAQYPISYSIAPEGRKIPGDPNGALYCQQMSLKIRWRIRSDWRVKPHTYIGKPNESRNVNQTLRTRHDCLIWSNAKYNTEEGNGDNACNLVTARPGDLLRWDHYLRNDGKEEIDRNVTVHIDLMTRPKRGQFSESRFRIDWGQSPQDFAEYRFGSGIPPQPGGGTPFFDTPSLLRRNDWNARRLVDNYHVTQNDVSNYVCGRVAWLPHTPDDGGWGHSTAACAYVPYHYPGCPEGDPSCTPNNCTMRGDCPGGTPVKRGVKPSVGAQPATVEAGGTATFTYNLNNAGPTKSKDLHYQAYTFILRSGAGLPDNSPRTVAYPMSWGAVGCGGRHVGWGSYRDGKCAGGISGNTVVYPGKDVKMTRQYRVADLGAERWLAQPGDKICSYLALDQRWNVYNDVDSRTFVASNIACVTITKKPSLQLIGSDSYAKYGFTGSDVMENMVLGTDKRGSYSQYGLLTDKVGVTNFGSAGYTTASQANYKFACKLSYANTDSAQVNCNDLNGLQPAGLSKNLSVPSRPASTTFLPNKYVTLNKLKSGSYYRSGELYIGKSELKLDQHITIFVDGDVNIRGEITNSSNTYTKLSEIPSLTIKAKNIKVEPQVERIAGTYVATGRFESCNGGREKGDTLGAFGLCRSKLKVNGAIVSVDSPLFRRTFGAGNEPDDDQWNLNKISSTAEWINYTPNLWLTTSNGSSGNQLEGLTTTQVTNLPVRY